MRSIMLLWVIALMGCTMTNSAQVHEANEAGKAELARTDSEDLAEAGEDTISATAMGPICWAAIIEAVSSYGERCLSKERPEFRAALNSSREKFDRRFRAAGWSEEALSAFRTQMSEIDKTEEEVCSNKDADQFYRHLEAAGPEKLEAETDRQIARPDQPQWGTCL